jgi:hypothetical protein
MTWRDSLPLVIARADDLYDAHCFAGARELFTRAAVLAAAANVISVETEQLEAAYWCHLRAGGQVIQEMLPACWRTLRRRSQS